MSSANDQEPWAFGIEVTDISRSVIGARYELLPYLYSVFALAAETGAPVLRPLVYEFQADPAVRTLDDEAMLGPSLLYAPILAEGATSRQVYLPAGRWFEFHSGAIVEGPASIALDDLTLAALPMFVREGAIIPRAERMAFTDEKAIERLYLDLYPAEKESSFVLYEDDGESFAHEQGAFSRLRYTLVRTASGAALTAAPREGTYKPAPRSLVMRVRRADKGVQAVLKDGSPLPVMSSYDGLIAAGKGVFYDERDLSIVVAIPDEDDFTVEFVYDPTVADPAPSVKMEMRVKVPPGTPTGTPIHIATNANGWTHQPLAWGPGSDTASGFIEVPRGKYVFYKYTRGDWGTVEKWPGCVEATNRYEFGKAHPIKEDAVFQWADFCP